ncbi:MAG: V-type ATPase subunit [Candidatus Dojkabacteria bacterium]|nr:V-type ATPase subunit [Candidatus Methanofastidiosa archaeon]
MGENYGYLNARISAMKSELIPVEAYHKMMLMELPDITRTISEGAYKEDVTELSKNFRGADLIEYALNLNLARAYQKLITISKGTAHTFIVAYMERWDKENVTSILRGTRSGIGPQEIAETLVPVGKLSFPYLLSLTHRSYEEAVADLEGKDIIPRDAASPVEREREMDRQYYEQYYAVAVATGDRKAASFVRREIDYRNLKILLRLLAGGTPAEDIEQEMVYRGDTLTKETVRGIARLSLTDARTRLGSLFPELSLKKDEDVAITEQRIDRALILYGEKLAHLHMFSPLAVLGFILRKYQEILNLRLIVRGKQLSMPPNVMKTLLVV